MADEQAQVEAGGEATAFGSSEFEALLQKEFRPKSDQAKSAVENAVKTLAQQALDNTALISDDALRSIEGIVAEIDKKLTEQVSKPTAFSDGASMTCFVMIPVRASRFTTRFGMLRLGRFTTYAVRNKKTPAAKSAESIGSLPPYCSSTANARKAAIVVKEEKTSNISL